MQKFLDDLFNPYWLISVVVVGILINLFSAYFRDVIDKVFSSFSYRWQRRTAAKRKRVEKEVESLIGNKFEQTEMRFAEMRARFTANQNLIWIVILVIISIPIFNSLKEEELLTSNTKILLQFMIGLLFLICNINGLLGLFKAQNINSVILKAKEREQELVNQNKEPE